MLCVNVKMKFTHEPLKRTPIELVLDVDQSRIGPVPTDRSGQACFDLPTSSGKILISGVERFQGRLEGNIDIDLFNLTEPATHSAGSAGSFTTGSNAYPDMTTRSLQVNGRNILTDSEGYLVDPDDWSEEFVRQLAQKEGLKLSSEHWEVIRLERQWYASHGTQAIVRDLVKAFRLLWGKERGNSRYLHQLFPRGGPQKQGNRLAGLLRPKGEV